MRIAVIHLHARAEPPRHLTMRRLIDLDFGRQLRVLDPKGARSWLANNVRTNGLVVATPV
jgi:hypothetical protein